MLGGDSGIIVQNEEKKFAKQSLKNESRAKKTGPGARGEINLRSTKETIVYRFPYCGGNPPLSCIGGGHLSQ